MKILHDLVSFLHRSSSIIGIVLVNNFLWVFSLRRRADKLKLFISEKKISGRWLGSDGGPIETQELGDPRISEWIVTLTLDIYNSSSKQQILRNMYFEMSGNNSVEERDARGELFLISSNRVPVVELPPQELTAVSFQTSFPVLANPTENQIFFSYTGSDKKEKRIAVYEAEQRSTKFVQATGIAPTE
jgi:hypothetical protein